MSDVDLGEDVDLLVDLERTICSVQVPKVVAADEEVPEEELEEGEIEGEVEGDADAAAEEGSSGSEEA